MAKILIVEDEEEILESIELVLKSQGHTIESASDGAEASQRLKIYPYDLIVLDINLPIMSGHEILRQFRAAGGKTPVLMLTAQDSVESKVAGLDGGADDYLVKPFNAAELSARARALLRRNSEEKSSILSCGSISLDTVSRQVLFEGQPVQLLPKEFALLEFFLRNQGQYFSADALLERVWSAESDSTKETVRVWIKRLRDKLGGLERCPIKTEAGVGYTLQAAGKDR
ncbi:MAG: response regulator transcription factor [Candidatus Obscuribacterales bacterium]|nr:response regulator transcription factor [Candidatus Obscuribacterales bacterium]